MTAAAPVKYARELPSGEVFYSPLGLFRFQVEGIEHTYDRLLSGEDGVLTVYDTGIGKQAPVSEPVCTPSGWRPIGDITPGDQVMAADGTPATVTSIHPQHTRETYRVTFSDGSWTRCGPDHLWTVRRWRTGRKGVDGKARPVLVEETLMLREIMQRGIRDSQGRRRWHIPMATPVQHPRAELPMDPYALGVVLGDGTVHPAGNVSITTDKEVLDLLGITAHRGHHESEGIEVLQTSRWRLALRELGLNGYRSWEKFVPEQYLIAHETDRRALLAGLLDTDGSPMRDGGIEYCSTSEALVDAVMELTTSLGGVARNKTSRVTTYTHNGERREGRTSWRVNLKLDDNPFLLTRKAIVWVAPTKYPPRRYLDSIERVEDEDSVCIKIDREDGLYLTRHHIVTHNTVMFCALAAFAIADGTAEQVIVICERNKLRDWRDAFERFTALSALLYHGTGRQKRLEKFTAKNGHPHVLITTYETGARDLMVEEKVKGQRTKARSHGSLWADLGLAERRSLWGFDEITKLMSRTTKVYQGLDYTLTELRRNGARPMVAGYTATPISRNYEQGYNIGKIVCPGRMPTRTRFEQQFCFGGKLDKFGNLRVDRREEQNFAELFQGLMIRKRKTDPDVIDQFPATVEKSIKVELTKEHKDFYRLVSELFDPEPGEPDERTDDQHMADAAKLRTLLRMSAGHPASHAHAENDVSQLIASSLGIEALREIGSSKTDVLLTHLRPIIKGQGDQVVIFTYYRVVLYELCRELQGAGYSVATYHGQNSVKANADAEAKFAAHEVDILLCTDAAARGLNLQAGSYCIEYESADTFLNRTQRLNRIHRIDSQKSLVTFYTMLLEGTVEEDIIRTTLNRNERQDVLIGDKEDDTEFVSAEQRRERLLG